MLTQLPGSIYQVAYLVPGLEPAAKYWSRVTGAGPFFAFRHFAFIDPLHRGKPVSVDISVALGFSAGMCVELIEMHDERPSIYRDWQLEHGYVLHHVAMLSEDFPADMERQAVAGAPAVFTAGFGDGTRLAYLDTRASMGCYLEVVEFSEFVRGALDHLREAHDSWDGGQPLRDFTA